MIDTIKLGIPLTQYQFEKILKHSTQQNSWQWVLAHPATGEIRFLRVKGLAELDRKSFHRDIVWYVPDRYTSNETFLLIELSIPKFYYGQNIELLYDFTNALQLLKNNLQAQLHCRFVEVFEWRVFRVDICYAWRVPNQAIAQQLLDSLKRIHYPRKQPILYPTTIQFTGKTYSLKFYLKHPEFMRHDRKILLKQKADLQWISHLEELSLGVLRCEATLRQKYLRRQEIETVADLARPIIELLFDENYTDLNPDVIDDEIQRLASIYIIADHHLNKLSIDSDQEIDVNRVFVRDSSFDDRDFYEAPPMEKNFHGKLIKHNGGGFTMRTRANPIAILQYFMSKFLGENRGMDTAEQVQNKLLEKYKPVKAARLTSMWLYVQRFGTEKARDFFGHNSYYVGKRDMKVAGVSLVEPPKAVSVNERFLESFQFDVPSEYAVNKFDNYRDHTNVINLIPKNIEKG